MRRQALLNSFIAAMHDVQCTTNTKISPLSNSLLLSHGICQRWGCLHVGWTSYETQATLFFCSLFHLCRACQAIRRIWPCYLDLRQKNKIKLWLLHPGFTRLQIYPRGKSCKALHVSPNVLVTVFSWVSTLVTEAVLLPQVDFVGFFGGGVAF